MGEDFTVGPDGKYNGELANKRMVAWDEWSENREVQPENICDYWENNDSLDPTRG